MLGASSYAIYGSPGARAVHDFMPFVTPRYPRLDCTLIPRIHGQSSQSFPGQVEAGEFCVDVWLLETRVGLVWYVEVPRDTRGWFPSTSWEKGGEAKVVLLGDLLT
jgi:hypothetical protein